MVVATLDVQKFLSLRESDPERYEYENLLMNMMGGLGVEHLSQDERALILKYGKPGDTLHSSVMTLTR